jgi:hypothetical protein
MIDAAENLDMFGVVADTFNGKVFLTCKKHVFSYKPNQLATPGCHGCHLVQHLGLIMAVPEERREEILENLEYSIHHLVEADRAGTLDIANLEKHGVRVKIESEDGKVTEY